MRCQHKVSWVIISLTGLLLMISSGRLVVRAADSTMVDIVRDGTVVGPNFQKNNGQVLTDNASNALAQYPTLTEVAANNVENGRITSQTTQIKIRLTGALSLQTQGRKLSDLYFDVIDDDGNSYRTDQPKKLDSSPFTTYDFDNNGGPTQVIAVNLSDLRHKFPVYVGFHVKSSNRPNLDIRYQLGKFTADQQTSAKLQPTITSALKDTDTTITGTGTNPGDLITSNIDSTTTLVGADKTFSLNLSRPIGAGDTVTITESNVNGDAGSTSKAVFHQKLILTISNSTVSTGDQITSKLSDAAVMDWLTKQAGLAAKFNDDSSTAGVVFKTDMTDLAAKINALSADDVLALPIYAQLGAIKSDPQTVTIKHVPGTIGFDQVSTDISFGRLPLPTREMIYQPTVPWQITLKDSRMVGATWYVYASATPLMSPQKHTLTGDLVYWHGNTRDVLTNQTALISSGKRETAEKLAITDDWSASKGIFLRVEPGVYAESYSGAVNWSLQDTPNQ